MPPDELLLYAVLMPAAAAVAVLLLPSAPWARVAGDAAPVARREPWLAGAACAVALCASLVITDGWPWLSAWSSWKLIYASAGVVSAAAAVVCIRGVPRAETVALAAAAAVLWYRVPEARDIGVRVIAAAVAAAVGLCVWRSAQRAPAWSTAASAMQALALAGLIGSSGSSKVAAAAAALALTLVAGTVAARVSRTFSCGACAALTGGGLGAALALYGRGYHGDTVAPWIWWSVAAMPGALCLPWALAPTVRKPA
jgi:hypothetical protein